MYSRKRKLDKFRLDSPHKKSPTRSVGLFLSRDGEIRTHDPLHPMQVRYRAALHPEVSLKITALFSDRFVQFSTSR